MKNNTLLKSIPLEAVVELEQMLEKFKGFELELANYLMIKAVNADMDRASRHMAELLCSLTEMIRVGKNEEIRMLTLINEIISFGAYTMKGGGGKKKPSWYKEPIRLHHALHRLSFMHRGNYYPKQLMEDDKFFCDALYEKYKDINLKEIHKDHYTYGKDINPYVIPYLEGLISEYRKHNSDN